MSTSVERQTRHAEYLQRFSIVFHDIRQMIARGELSCKEAWVLLMIDEYAVRWSGVDDVQDGFDDEHIAAELNLTALKVREITGRLREVDLVRLWNFRFIGSRDEGSTLESKWSMEDRLNGVWPEGTEPIP